MTAIGSSWRPYGLRMDPYFQEPLTPDADAVHPVSLFVGREEELRLLGSQVLGATSSRAIVQGPFGVGKTSFANRLKAVLANHGVLTHAQRVRVTSEMTVQSFSAEVLRVLTQIRASLIATEEGDTESEATVAFWRRVGRQLDGEDIVNGGVSIAGVGASISRSRIAAERRDLSLFADLEEAIAWLTVPQGLAHEPRRVLLHVNNLENLTRADVAHAAGLIQDLRDCFLIPNSHWVFVGAMDVEQTVFRASEAVSGIVPLVADLLPLLPADVTELLRLRYERMRVGVRFTPPVAPDAVEVLYRRYDGDLRNFLRVLSNAVQRTPIGGAPASLTIEAVVHTMAEPYRRSLWKLLGDLDAEHLAVVVKDAQAGVTFRAADVMQRTALAKATVTALLDRWQAKRVIRYSHVEGRNTYYRLTPDAEIAFDLL